jgi:hypothetical protein
MKVSTWNKGKWGFGGRRGGDRTHNPRLRRPVLYPIELLARVSIVTLNRRTAHAQMRPVLSQARPSLLSALRRMRPDTL